MVINKHWSLFCYSRLPLEFCLSQGFFRVMEVLIQGVLIYLDGVSVTEKNRGRTLEGSSCVFLAPSVVYLWHTINKKGLHPVAEKMQAQQETPKPTNGFELKSALDLCFQTKCLMVQKNQ